MRCQICPPSPATSVEFYLFKNTTFFYSLLQQMCSCRYIICFLIELNETFMDWFFIFVIDARFTSAHCCCCWSGSVHLHIWVCSIWKKKFNFSTAGTKFYNYYKIFVQFISAAIKEDFFPETNSDMKVHHQNNIAAPT